MPSGEVPVHYPGAEEPSRRHHVDAHGVRLAVHEWGDAGSPPLFLVHGGSDFARTFSGLAPRLARAGWRVVAWDQRGHGDSDHTALYSWDADLRDAATVIDRIASGPAPVVGHSKGGALSVQLADAQPFRFSHLVNLDGLPSKRPMADLAGYERRRMMAGDIAAWLDHRRRTGDLERRPGTLDELAERRAYSNPRMSREWLRYLVSVGARRDPDGWRWKLDPSIRFVGFGPWRPEWTAIRLPGLAMPFLGVLGGIEEPMGWGTGPEQITPLLPTHGRLETLADVGHFLHIERPDEIAAMILDFVGSPR